MLRTGLISDARELEALAPEWWDLWGRTEATPFQSPAWLIPWWHVFAQGELAALTIHRDGRLVAFAPFYVEPRAHGSRLLSLGIGTTDYLDVLVAPEEDDAASTAIANSYSELPNWNRWELEELPAWASAQRLPKPECCDERSSYQSTCPLLVRKGEAGLDALPARQRRKLRMTQHRMQRRGVSVRPIGSGETADFVNGLIRLHQARWAAQNEAGVFADGRMRCFLAEAVEGLGSAGLLRAFLAQCEGRIVAAYYGLAHRSRAYAYIGGFDPEFAYESPGTALLGAAIENAFADGAREFHFLRGCEAYKYAWGAEDHWNVHRSLWRRK